MAIIRVPNNWKRGYPKRCCLYIGLILLAVLHCLASEQEEVHILAVALGDRVEGYPEGPQPYQKRMGWGHEWGNDSSTR